MPELLTYVRDELIAQGVVRDPRVAGSLPPFWREPRHATPAPGERPPGGATVEVGDDAVVGAFKVAGIPPRRHEGFLRTDGVDFWIRTRTAPRAHELERQIRLALNDKRNWIMAGLRVHESLLFRDLSPVERTPDGFTYTLGYLFWLWEPGL